jgi:pyridoxal phosphate enzyme (YggS family)
MVDFNKNLDNVIANVEKARLSVNAHHIVKIVGVSKYSNVDDIKSVYELGQRAFGENKVQDLKEKSEVLSQLPIEWHFIGRLQTNKINHLLELNPFLVQSIDGTKLADEVNKRAIVKDKKIDVLLQINSANEHTKAGTDTNSAIEEYLYIKENCKNLNIKGVMSIGAHTDDTKEIQKSFEQTFGIYEKLQKEGATICSMGMSSDYELAIKCGSNLVRVGSSIFK